MKMVTHLPCFLPLPEIIFGVDLIFLDECNATSDCPEAIVLLSMNSSEPTKSTPSSLSCTFVFS